MMDMCRFCLAVLLVMLNVDVLKYGLLYVIVLDKK